MFLNFLFSKIRGVFNFFSLKLNFLLNTVDLIDKVLIFLFPGIFALNRTIVLRKISEG